MPSGISLRSLEGNRDNRSDVCYEQGSAKREVELPPSSQTGRVGRFLITIEPVGNELIIYFPILCKSNTRVSMFRSNKVLIQLGTVELLRALKTFPVKYGEARVALTLDKDERIGSLHWQGLR